MASLKPSQPDLCVILTQINGHLTNAVNGHSKFIPSYQFTSIYQSVFILDYGNLSEINFQSVLNKLY